jgi:hypothetical protein
VHDRDQIVVRLYFDNDSAANLNLIATDTRVRLAFLHRLGTDYAVRAYVTARNANPQTVWDSIHLTAHLPFTVAYKRGSAKLFNNRHRGLRLSDKIVTQGGSLVGCSMMDGRVSGSTGECSGWVIATLQIRKVAAAGR